jgi:hypothetical protein
MTKLKYLAVTAAISLAGCTTLPPSLQKAGTPIALSAGQLAAVESGVRQRLKDPASAMFGSTTLAAQSADGEITACGFVNAKNSFGGYTGSSLYIAILRGGTVVDATIEDSGYQIVRSFCQQRGVLI